MNLLYSHPKIAPHSSDTDRTTNQEHYVYYVYRTKSHGDSHTFLNSGLKSKGSTPRKRKASSEHVVLGKIGFPDHLLSSDRMLTQYWVQHILRNWLSKLWQWISSVIGLISWQTETCLQDCVTVSVSMKKCFLPHSQGTTLCLARNFAISAIEKGTSSSKFTASAAASRKSVSPKGPWLIPPVFLSMKCKLK